MSLDQIPTDVFDSESVAPDPGETPEEVTQRLTRELHTMVTEIYTVVHAAAPAIQRLSTEVNTMGMAGLLGALMRSK